jgi:magnesium chelatase family protein
MVTRVATVAFRGVEARAVDVQVQLSAGGVNVVLVGLGDKTVAESKERLRSALIASGLALPARRLTVKLAPADMPKEGSHDDLPITLGNHGRDRRDTARCLAGFHRSGWNWRWMAPSPPSPAFCRPPWPQTCVAMG